jgi:hypothetical protein
VSRRPGTLRTHLAVRDDDRDHADAAPMASWMAAARRGCMGTGRRRHSHSQRRAHLRVAVGHDGDVAVAQLVLDYVRVLVWPLVVVVIVLSLRRQLPGIFSRFRTGEISAAGFQLKVELAEATAQVTAARAEIPVSPNADQVEAVKIVEKEFESFFDQVPRPFPDMPPNASNVIWSFLALVKTVTTAAKLLDIAATTAEANEPGSRGTHVIELERLVDIGVVGPHAKQAMDRLGKIFGKTAREPESIDLDMASMFRQTAMAMGEVIVTRAKQVKKSQEA